MYFPNSGIESLICFHLFINKKSYGMQIYKYLTENELIESQLTSTIYNCLKSLENKNLVIKNKEGRLSYYSLTDEGNRLIEKSKILTA